MDFKEGDPVFYEGDLTMPKTGWVFKRLSLFSEKACMIEHKEKGSILVWLSNVLPASVSTNKEASFLLEEEY